MAMAKKTSFRDVACCPAEQTFFMDYGDIIAKQYGIKLVIQFTDLPT